MRISANHVKLLVFLSNGFLLLLLLNLFLPCYAGSRPLHSDQMQGMQVVQAKSAFHWSVNDSVSFGFGMSAYIKEESHWLNNNCMMCCVMGTPCNTSVDLIPSWFSAYIFFHLFSHKAQGLCAFIIRCTHSDIQWRVNYLNVHFRNYRDILAHTKIS